MHDALEEGEGDGKKLGLRVKMRWGEKAPPPQGRVPAHTEEIPRCGKRFYLGGSTREKWTSKAEVKIKL